MKNLITLGASALIVSLISGCGGDDTSGACGGDFPDAPSGAGTTLYVSSGCAAPGADGTATHAYPTISQALAAAPKGAAILVASGTYAENLTISQDVTVIGAFSQAAGDAPFVDGSDGAIILQAPNPEAITVGAGAHVAITGMTIASPTRIGVWAKGGFVTMSHSTVDGTLVGAKGVGDGVVASDSGAIILQDSAITGSARYGAFITEASGSLQDASFAQNLAGGVRLDHASETIAVDHVLFDGNSGFGVGVFSSAADIENCTIQKTTLDATGFGDGILSGAISVGGKSLGNSDVTAKGNAIQANSRVGILMSGGTGGIILQDNMVTDNATAKESNVGAGLWLQGGAGSQDHSMIKGNHMIGNRFSGIGLSGDTHGIILQDNESSGTTSGSIVAGGDIVSVGDGVTMLKGASGDISANHFENNARFGFMIDSAMTGAVVGIQNNYVQDNDKGGIILQHTPDASALGANHGASTRIVGPNDAPVGFADPNFGSIGAQSEI